MFDRLRACNAKFDSDILEIGSGVGGFLAALHRLGFKSLTGLDLFIDRDVSWNGIRVLKRNLADLNGEYDVVIARDTIEHMPNQADVTAHIHRLLRRMPIGIQAVDRFHR